jgi:hypothetical protein
MHVQVTLVVKASCISSLRMIMFNPEAGWWLGWSVLAGAEYIVRTVPAPRHPLLSSRVQTCLDCGY